MARKRDIDPALWENEQLGSVQPMARLLFIGCISQADDEGRLKGSAVYLKAKLFPYDGKIAASKVLELRDALVAAGLVCTYQAGDEEYLHLPTWHTWQKMSRFFGSRLPACPRTHEKTAVRNRSGTSDAPVTNPSTHTVPGPVAVTGSVAVSVADSVADLVTDSDSVAGAVPGPGRDARAGARGPAPLDGMNGSLESSTPTGTKGAPAGAPAPAAPPSKVPISNLSSPEGPLALLAEAFSAQGLAVPQMTGREGSAAMQLLALAPPGRIAEFAKTKDARGRGFGWMQSSGALLAWLEARDAQAAPRRGRVDPVERGALDN